MSNAQSSANIKRTLKNVNNKTPFPIDLAFLQWHIVVVLILIMKRLKKKDNQ